MDKLEFAAREPEPDPLGFAMHEGQVASLLRDSSFRTSALGDPALWSPCLKTLISTVLPVESQIVIFWGPQFVALYNDAYAPTIGNKHPAALGRPAIEHWRELWDDLEPLLRGVRETGKTFSAKDRPFYLERHGRGEHVNFDISYSAVRESDGTVGGVLCIVSETTERVQFERRQAILVDLGKAIPGTLDPGEITALLFDCLATELRPDNMLFAEQRPGARQFKITQRPHNATASDSAEALVFDTETLQILAQGSPVIFGQGCDPLVEGARWVDDGQTDKNERLCIPLFSQGDLLGLIYLEAGHGNHFSRHAVAIAQDAAKLVWTWVCHARSEMALRRSSAQLSAMFEQANVGIAICSPSGVFERVNDRYWDLVGRAREEMLGLTYNSLSFADYPPPDALFSRHGAHEFVASRRNSGASLSWIHHHITPFHETNGAQSGVLWVTTDITDRIKAENDLKAINSSLEARVNEMVSQREETIAQLHEARKMDMLGQLSGGIAHDFNNLLTPIIASMELLQRQPKRARAPALIDASLQAAERARLLVGKLLSFARRQTLAPEVVDIAVLLDDMRDLLQRSLTPVHQVIMDIDPDLPTVLVDPRQLELSILNLAVNARDAMKDGGRLEIIATPEHLPADATIKQASGNYVCLRVRDFGHGMSDDVLNRCIEPFFSTKGIGKGTGLGLSMVQGLALQSGGKFSITSTPGQGTTVALWLPVAGGEPRRISAIEPTELILAPFPARVLLVDDDDSVRFTTGLQLRELGYEVIEATSGEAALKIVEDGFVPQLLISDQMMPGKTGIELAQALRRQRPTLAVLIITGFANVTQAQLGEFKVLPKPFHHPDLASTVFQLLTEHEEQGK